MEQPLILVDVDGVLNPYRRPGPQWQLHNCRSHDRSYNVWLNPAHGPALLALAEKTGAQLTWATTWEHHANNSIGPLIGLPELPVIYFDDEVDELGEYDISPLINIKTPAVARYVQGRPFVWFDDALTGDDWAWLREQQTVGQFNLIQVYAWEGLADSHLDQAAAWLTNIEAGH